MSLLLNGRNIMVAVSLILFLILVSLFILQFSGTKYNQICVPRRYRGDSFVCVCNATYCDSIVPVPNKLEPNEYVVYTTTKNKLRLEQSIHTFETNEVQSTVDIVINRTEKYQTIMGFGGAITDAVGINIASLSKPGQDLLLQQYFGPDGSQYTFIRVPIGGTDFSTRVYTLDDVPYDTNLTYFQLTEEDIKYKIPFIHQAKYLSKSPIKLLGCPWSAPAYMKSDNKIPGSGKLLTEYYQVYANYLIKFLQAYKAHDLNFDLLSTQNEPLFVSPHIIFNGMTWNPSEQADFIVNNLGPSVVENNFENVKIIFGEEQRNVVFDMVMDTFKKENISKYVNSLAVHWYRDSISSPKILTDIHNLKEFENKFILYTESSLGYKDQGFRLGYWQYAESYMNSIIETLNNWVVGWIDWNIALDTHGGPNWANNILDSPISVNASSQEFYKNPTYYAIAHVSKFIPPGSVRIQMINGRNNITGTAFETPNNDTVIVLSNSANQQFNLSIQDIGLNKYLNLDVPPNSFLTVIY